jgi:prevent-host-death family protein
MGAKRIRLRTIEASELRKNCVAVLREIEQTGSQFLVTKNGRPVAKLRPHVPDSQVSESVKSR